MSPQEQPMALVQAFVEAIHQQNWNRLTSVVAPNFIRHSYAGCEPSIYSRDDLVSFLKQEYTTFPDAQETIEALIASGDRVTVRPSVSGYSNRLDGDISPSDRVLTVRSISLKTT